MKKTKSVSFALAVILIFFSLLSSLVAYAEENKAKSSWLLGDADDSGEVDTVDATFIQRYATRVHVMISEEILMHGDVDEDGDLTVVDATFIQRFSTRVKTPYRIGEPVDQEEPIEGQYVVTFVGCNGVTLKKQTVECGKNAEPPEANEKPGAEFLGWSGNYIDVEQNETVNAVYSNEKNVIMTSSVDGHIGDTVSVLVSLEGTVKTCGFDMDILYDSDLELVSYDDDLDLDIITNADRYENGMKLNFTSTLDKTKQRDIIKLDFRIKSTAANQLPVRISVRSMKEIINNNPLNTDYIIVNGIVSVI